MKTVDCAVQQARQDLDSTVEQLKFAHRKELECVLFVSLFLCSRADSPLQLRVALLAQLTCPNLFTVLLAGSVHSSVQTGACALCASRASTARHAEEVKRVRAEHSQEVERTHTEHEAQTTELNNTIDQVPSPLLSCFLVHLVLLQPLDNTARATEQRISAHESCARVFGVTCTRIRVL